MRTYIGNSIYRQCTRCVMDTTFGEISFDEDGVCNYCHEYDEVAARVLLPPAEAKKRADGIIAEIKAQGKGKEYDCLLGLSGGVDSSYLALKLKEYGVRVLCVQFDNGWNSELAVHNIHNICSKLDLDLETYVVNWREFRDLQLAFMKASVTNIEIPTDHAIFATLYRVAKERDIKCLMNGNNVVNEQIVVPEYCGYRYNDLTFIKDIQAKFGSVPLKTYPQMSWYERRVYYEGYLGLYSVSLLNSLPYHKQHAVDELKEKLDWQEPGGKHHESIFTRFHQTQWMIKRYGIDKRKMHLSNQIHSGQIQRVQALDELAGLPCSEDIQEDDFEYVAKKLKISEDELQEIMDAPAKTFRDYNNELEFINLVEKSLRGIHNIRRAYHFMKRLIPMAN